MNADALDLSNTDNNTHSLSPNTHAAYTTLLGLDFGLKRIGLAVGQIITATATPLKTLDRSEPNNPAILEPIIQEWQPDAIIIGYPLHADASKTKLCDTIKKFGDQLQLHYKIPVHYENEYLSSQEAETIIKEKRNSGLFKHSTRKGDVDKYAAALILQRWLDKQSNEHKHI